MALIRALGLITFIALLGPGQAAEQAYRVADCGNPLVRVNYVHDVDLEHGCEGLRRAMAFLIDGYGLKLVRPFVISFKERVDLDLNGGRDRIRVLGTFNRTARQIELTTMRSDWLKDPDRLLFQLPIDDELHISLVVHEIAHAITKDNYKVADPSIGADEYLAYAVQLSTMEPSTRERVLQNYVDLDFKSVDEITEILHLAKSHEFGVRAYRHFVREGYTYMVDEILSGRFRTYLPEILK